MRQRVDRVTYAPDKRRLQTVTPEQVFKTPHRSPQLPLWTWGEEEWLPVLRLPASASRRSPVAAVVQRPLVALDEVGA
jgi:hypothetical protein